MMELFRGFAGAHGTHGTPTQGTVSTKLVIKTTARTVRDPVTVQLWEEHLSGERPIGIIPIREDSTCLWGAIDIDKYTIVHADLVRELAELKAPVVVCRSKSGGAHLYMFLSEPAPAGEVQARLRDLASVLGHGDSEIFPKQDQVLLDRGDLGNWMSMPYLGGNSTQKYAVNDSGRGLTVGQFLTRAEDMRIPRSKLQSLSFTRPVAGMSEGPPCLEHLASTGITPGAQNNGLFNLGVLAQKMQPDNWEPLLEEWNHKYLRPPAASGDVASVIRSLKKRQYSFKCSDQPIVSHCNMQVCRTRKHGIGPTGAAKMIETISILDTEPPLFFASLRTGGTIECDTSTLLDPRSFQRAALSQLRQVLPMAKLDDWLQQVQLCIEAATTIEAPREVGLTGQLEELLERFCTDRHAAHEKDELILGKPWRDDETDRVWFRLRDLQDMLERSRFRDFTRGQITTRIRSMGGSSGFFNIKGKGVNVWYVPVDKLTWSDSLVTLRRSDDAPL